ncbi:hypothetical protein PALU110988_30325 [Paenibacillus lupini]|uniref:hypothetical protein n=1 Tax=Paenibacillus lupini TaxID=1450204 RepID=UPI0014239ECB|nr:hypothetical protein [Paenibacillus lupini]NIK26896.1 hypothetical protein [Paenibacillus lupini]
MMTITLEKLYEFYINTMKSCGTYLLSSNDSVIGYNIFEQFDIGAVSFLHRDNLQKLFEAGLINDEVMNKSLILRSEFLELQQSDEWNINAVRYSSVWRQILKLADEINSLVERYTKEER